MSRSNVTEISVVAGSTSVAPIFGDVETIVGQFVFGSFFSDFSPAAAVPASPGRSACTLGAAIGSSTSAATTNTARDNQSNRRFFGSKLIISSNRICRREPRSKMPAIFPITKDRPRAAASTRIIVSPYPSRSHRASRSTVSSHAHSRSCRIRALANQTIG